ncbi:response regulator [Gloeocapsa sp. PCC 73106]|uniref:response regulator n=1 Tax=Gloeocapsa sp. PCC 73106 TaxID=102232 RepID=UPI0002ACAAE9|nr:response regulator [Gloeocapsa sp. PCC 73106]ELS00093.1 CheY-like receiver domain-containing protein [Gloeocapsa sp. PCC 73106]
MELEDKSINQKQAGLFYQLQKSQFSGKMLIKAAIGSPWIISFYLGRIIYATGGRHPVRRYQRNIAIHLPQILKEFLELRDNPQLPEELGIEQYWEYDLLVLWLKQQKIETKQVNQFITSQVKEILFDLTQAKQVNIEYQEGKTYSNPLTLINPELVTLEAWKLKQNWQNAKLADRCPDFAPVIVKPEELGQKVSNKTFQGMAKLLDGTKSIRDLTTQLSTHNLIEFTSLLRPYIERGLIELVEIPDLSLPIRESTIYIPLVACVDDSPSICKTMESVVKASGYRFLGISDEMRAINLLLKHKPDLIFLDFVMPKINGYELCSMLRKVPELKDKPIVILSAYKNIVERFRGKISGCSSFLYKPIQTEHITDTMAKYLK